MIQQASAEIIKTEDGLIYWELHDDSNRDVEYESELILDSTKWPIGTKIVVSVPCRVKEK